jgi:hypothetical protein
MESKREREREREREQDKIKTDFRWFRGGSVVVKDSVEVWKGDSNLKMVYKI